MMPPELPPQGLYRTYQDVPWFRRSPTNTAFILIALFTCGLVPLTLATCVILLTGDVYYNSRDAQGNLAKWSFANKVVAVLILVGNVLRLVALFAGLATAGR
jgi:hypothetical protein